MMVGTGNGRCASASQTADEVVCELERELK